MVSRNEVTILLVDDDDVDVESIRRALKKAKIANPVVVAHDGVDALDALRGTGGRERVASPYVVLLDLNMPRMSGLEFLDEIREDTALRRAVVFVLTTSNAERDRAAAYDRLIAGYMVKSRVGQDFLDLLSMLGAYWKVVELPEIP